MCVTFLARWRGGARAGIDRSVEAVPVVRRGARQTGGIKDVFLFPLFRFALAGVDARRRPSPKYGRWRSFELSDDEQVSVYIPPGGAHGSQALTGPADVAYRIDRPYDPAEDVAIAFDDPELAIPWPLPVSVISRRDRLAPPPAAAFQASPWRGERRGPTPAS